jgi:hypothetical protein
VIPNSIALLKTLSIKNTNDVITGGQILFSEFVDWALEKNLDLEDDVDIEVLTRGNMPLEIP